jgi:hypothetical protein
MKLNVVLACDNGNVMPLIAQLEPELHCPKCKAPGPVTDDLVVDSFRAVLPVCKTCQEPIDVWDAVKGMLSYGNKSFSYHAIGAKQAIIMRPFPPGEKLHVDFFQEGVPQDARLLNIYYMPNGFSHFPAECHDNTPRRHLVPSRVTLWPVPDPKEAPAEIPLLISVTWMPNAAGDPAVAALVDAFEAFVAKKYDSFIVPANVAVEYRVGNIVSRVLSATSGKDHVRKFLDVASYSHQLNVLLPALLTPRKIALLPDTVRGFLNRLRGHRNDIAHRGALATPVPEKEAVNLLCAAFFGWAYCEFVSRELAKSGI